jgi:DNA-binding transcriptional LysR family regulator
MAACTAAGITPRLSHRANDWAAVIALAAAGAGVALVPALALGDGHLGVAVIPVGPETPARSIYAAVRNGSATAPHIAAVLAALRAVTPGARPSAVP